MSEKRFEFKLKVNFIDEETGEEIYHKVLIDNSNGNEIGFDDMVGLLNEQQELIEELHISDEMGWKRAEKFEKKCPKELHNKKMYIKRLEYKVQKFKEENEHLKNRLYDFEKRKIIEESEINEDVIPKVKMLRTKLFGEKYE